MNNIWLSADLHLQHANILKYDNRPYGSIEEHDEDLIKTHNKYVKKNDIWYFVGDFCFNKLKTEEYLKRLNGIKYFIQGNHDYNHTVKLFEQYGTFLGEKKTLKINGIKVILNHTAERVWPNSHHGSFMLYAHSHDKLESDPWGKSMDVGVVSAYRLFGEYRPFNWNEIKQILDARPMKIIDHPCIKLFLYYFSSVSQSNAHTLKT